MKSHQPADIRQSILEEATCLFVSRGYHGISMREIAEAVGMSKAGLYYHFEDKEALFLAILTASLERIESLIQAARREGTTTRDQISRMMRAIFEQSPDRRAIIRLASQEMAHLNQAAQAEFGRLYHEKFIGQVEGILRAGVERGELRGMNLRLATWVLLGMAYPFFYPAHAREPGSPGEVSPDEASLDEVSPGEAVELMLAIFFDGAVAKGS
jgi:AcrR family transcriptional regulator